MSFPARSTSPSHYQVLQLQPSATDQELRQAFRALSKRYHPDTTTLPPQVAEAAFRQLRHAYAVLADPVARGAYDTSLGLGRPAPPVSPPPVTPPPAARVDRALPVRRAFSGGELFALLLLGVALVLSLVLGIGLAWARGSELMASPSWWSDPEAPAGAVTVGQPAAEGVARSADATKPTHPA